MLGRHTNLSRPNSFRLPEAVPTRSRFRNPIAKYRFNRNNSCISCGRCVEICNHGVHVMRRGKPFAQNHYLCVGKDCPSPCFEACPERALSMVINPDFESIGDLRWTPDLLASTWSMAEFGVSPPAGLEYRTGASGGGFDKLRLVIRRPSDLQQELQDDEPDVSVDLNRRNDSAYRVRIEVPFYGGGMSYGSVSITTMLSRIKAAAALGTFCCTGEGGYPDELKPYDDHVITQVATGLFGVKEETIQRVKIVEFKYAQGAKPGLGGHLLGDKVTPGVARMREAVAGFPLFSPFPFHSVYSVEDHKKHVDWIKAINPKAVISVKVSTPTDVDMVAVGSYYAGAHIIHLDGSSKKKEFATG
jgi:NAD-dependent dihydropyrimidine dehydrogenase PreA subunit